MLSGISGRLLQEMCPRLTTLREQSLPEVWYSARRADACSNQHDDVLDSIHSNLLNHVMYGAACLARTQCPSVEPSSSSCSSLFGKTIATMTIVNIVDCVPRVHHVRRKRQSIYRVKKVT